jgi:hypothetical protein
MLCDPQRQLGLPQPLGFAACFKVVSVVRHSIIDPANVDTDFILDLGQNVLQPPTIRVGKGQLNVQPRDAKCGLRPVQGVTLQSNRVESE